MLWTCLLAEVRHWELNLSVSWSETVWPEPVCYLKWDTDSWTCLLADVRHWDLWTHCRVLWTCLLVEVRQWDIWTHCSVLWTCPLAEVRQRLMDTLQRALNLSVSWSETLRLMDTLHWALLPPGTHRQCNLLHPSAIPLATACMLPCVMDCLGGQCNLPLHLQYMLLLYEQSLPFPLCVSDRRGRDFFWGGEGGGAVVFPLQTAWP